MGTLLMTCRQHLTASQVFLVILLIVTLLAGRVSDRLGLDVLLDVAAGVRVAASTLLLWIQRAIIVLALMLSLLGRRRDLWRLSVVTVGLVSIGLFVSVIALIVTLPRQSAADAYELLTDGVVLWLMNMLVFAAWYWLVDSQDAGQADAPGVRHDLLFPQQANDLPGWGTWRPRPLDYLYVAFNTSTAFGPTDTLFLTERAKLLMICQASISLLIIAVILARAVNVIQ